MQLPRGYNLSSSRGIHKPYNIPEGIICPAVEVCISHTTSLRVYLPSPRGIHKPYNYPDGIICPAIEVDISHTTTPLIQSVRSSRYAYAIQLPQGINMSSRRGMHKLRNYPEGVICPVVEVEISHTTRLDCIISSSQYSSVSNSQL